MDFHHKLFRAGEHVDGILELIRGRDGVFVRGESAEGVDRFLEFFRAAGLVVTHKTVFVAGDIRRSARIKGAHAHLARVEIGVDRGDKIQLIFVVRDAGEHKCPL